MLIKIEADSFLIIFKRTASALKCAVAMQHACQDLNRRRRPEEQVLLCVGLGYGEILVTAAVHDANDGLPGVTFEPIEVQVPGSDKNYRVAYAKH